MDICSSRSGCFVDIDFGYKKDCEIIIETEVQTKKAIPAMELLFFILLQLETLFQRQSQQQI